MTAPSREELARLIADELGFPYDSQHADKREWTATRGEKGGRAHDINEPFQADLDQVADAILARIGGGWRTMESAPKDGTSVLLFPNWIVSFWEEDGSEMRSGKPGWVYRYDSQWGAYLGPPREPTHWMPLPSPPGGGG